MTYPLSQNQMGIYATSMNPQTEGDYNMDFLYTLDRDVDVTQLANALEAVVEAHSYIKSRILTDDNGDIVLEDHTDENFHVAIKDVDNINDVRPHFGEAYDLMHDQLFRLEIYRTPENAYLYVDFNHIIFDGMSFEVFRNDLAEAYAGLALEAEAVNGFDVAKTEVEVRQSPQYEEAKEWYRQEFGRAASVNSMPMGDCHDFDPEACPFAFVWKEVNVDKEAMASLCEKTGVKESVVFTSAFGYTLSKFSGNSEVSFSTIFHGRTDKRTRHSFGMFVKTLPVYQNFEDTTTVSALLQHTSQQINEQRKRTYYSYGDLHHDLGIVNDVFFAFQGSVSDYGIILNSKRQKVEDLRRRRPGMKFNCQLFIKDGGYHLKVDYSADVFTQEFIDSFASSFNKTLSEMLQKEELKDISIVSEEQQKILDSFHTTAEVDVPYKRFYEPIEHYAEMTPDAKAVIACDRTLTYKEFNEEANRVAHALMDRGVKRGDRIVLLLPRTSQVLCCIFGVSKAGAAYIPCDPAYPAERINLITEDSGAKYVITTKEHVAEHGEKAILVDELFEASTTSNPNIDVSPEDLAYLIYTSGSTGRPKGVMLRHIGICSYLYDHPANIHIHGLKEEGVTAFLCITTLSFDMSLKEFGGALHNGLTAVLASDDEVNNPLLLAELFRKTGAQAINGTPSRIMGYMEIPEFENALSQCKVIWSGGEKYSPVLLDKLRSLYSKDRVGGETGLRIFNTYGPTETTVSSNIAELTHTSFVTVGRPLLNYHEWVVDADGHELPVGVVGELYIAGPGVAKGYNNLPEKTAASFIEYNGMRAYKSGDYARWTRDGHIEVLGRKDGQIKLHGLRIEIGEIESCINKFPGIKQSVVKVCHINDDDYIVAYFTASEQIDTNKLKAEISTTLTHYMVPSAFMQLDAFPLTPNGKTDIKNLPVPELAVSNEHQTFNNDGTTVLNDLEKHIYDLIATTLKMPVLTEEATPAFGTTDKLSLIGLSSLSAIKLATLIYKRFDIQLKPQQLVKDGTLLSIENEVLSQFLKPGQGRMSETNSDGEMRTQSEAKDSNILSIGKACLGTPLSFSQQGIYTECMANAGSVQYNIPSLLFFPKGTSAEKLKEAICKVVAAHPYMMCHFMTNDEGEVVQLPMQDFKLDIPVRKVSQDEFDALRKDLVHPFNLNKGPLFRFEIFEVEDTINLFADLHHLISDGASCNLVYNQICQILDGEDIESESYDYYQFVKDQIVDASAEQYLDQTIGGVEEVSRLLPDIYDENPEHRQKTITIPLNVADLEDICHKEGITPAAFFLAATAVTVSRYLCEEDVTMITISNGRSNLRIGDTVGMFVNTLPLALHVGTQDDISTVLHHAASVFAGAIEHETYPFARVASKYDFMPQISYTYQLGVRDSLHIKAGAVKRENQTLDIAKIPVAVYVEGLLDGDKYIVVDYDSSLYTETMIQHFAQSVANVAAALLEKKHLNEISLTTETDWVQLDTFNLPFFTDYDHTDTVVSLFQKQVQKHPDKTAAIFGDKRFTYRELDEATDRLAATIYNKVSKITGKENLAEEVVSIIIDRNEWVFLLPLAVLKTGCAYEPLDPSYPSERLNYMVQDAKAKLLIGQPQFIPQVSEYNGEVLLTTDLDEILNTPADSSASCDVSQDTASSKTQPFFPSGQRVLRQISPKDLLLMLYTSGSTGKPKGVQIEHHSLVSYAHGIAKADFYTEDCVAAAYASFGFDVCMSDTFCTLLNGGTLVIIPENLRLELKQLAQYLESEHVTQIFMTTQVGVQFLQNYPDVKYLRYLGMGGEKLPAVNPEGLSYHILNGYGPTENTCGVSLFPIQHWEPNIPLGKPFPTIKGYVLDKSGHRLPPGACGEYCVAGDQPARGYLGLPEKTAEVFVEYNDLRMYHTGDVVRYRENGDVEFVGRKDGMVKIRGFRIELKEVEAAIRPFEGIKDVTVQAYDYDGGGKYLAAFVVSDTPVDTSAIVAFVKSQKPPYMVPAIVMQIDRIPLTVNQKVDKKALPKPQLAAAAYVAPKNKIEEDFCEIFAEVLGQEKVSAASDFFEIGGSSIIALKVVVAAEKRGYTIVYNDVFTYTTALDMAEHLESTQSLTEGEASASADDNNQTSAIPSLGKSEGAYGPNTVEIGPDGFDYKEINALLRGNTMEAFRNGQKQPLGDVLLAGATGYLGIHVLKDLIDNYNGRIYCFVRGKGSVSAEKRLKNLLYYYFEHNYKELFGNRISIIEGDATDPKALDNFTPLPSTGEGQCEALTVINCAACVKHFSKGNEIERINVESVRNIIAWCIKSGSRLVHVSTGSVSGASVNNVPPKGFLFDEHVLYVGQSIDHSQYVSSKFKAEQLIYDAILHHGLNAKVMRVGNLAPRDKDGEFQINFKTNNFMASLAAYEALGMISYSRLDNHVEFSPIDEVARAILLLSTTPKECVCFMASNNHRPFFGDVMKQLSEMVTPIRLVEPEEFQKAVHEALNDPSKVDKMRPFMAYASSGTDNIRRMGYDDISVSYTAQILYRLGFRWSATTDEYVHKFLRTISGFNFFD